MMSPENMDTEIVEDALEEVANVDTTQVRMHCIHMLDNNPPGNM